ncbi:MAG: sulfatase-like hydrolase/transferase [Anaerolineales bacterium]
MREVPSRVPFHPLLFAAAVPLSLLAGNIDQVRPSVATRAILVAVTSAIVLWALARIVSGDWGRAALFASILIVLFSTYGLAYNFFRDAGELGWELARHRYMVPVWLVLLGLSMFALKRLRQSSKAMTSALNVAAAVLVLIPLAQITQYEFGSALANSRLSQTANIPTDLALPSEGPPPDIYYIITDAYSRDDYLLSNYGHDNSPFLEALEEMGFYIARCSQSNYARTDLSLASSLNLNYLEDLGDEFRAGNRETYGLDKLIRENLVQRELRALGYSVAAFETGFFYTQLEDAEHYYEVPKKGTLASFFTFGGINEFEALLIQNTGFRLLTDAATATGALSRALPSFGSIYRERTLYVLGQLEPEQVPALRGPKFVFVHLIAPHFPYVIDREGEFFNVETEPSDKEPYINQLIYLNGRLEQIIRDIIETAEPSPIIVLQADHGNQYGDGERNAILNAYFLPETEGHKPYPQISPVNTFRLIFDNYFGGDYGLLPDHSFFSTYEAPFDFETVPNTREGCEGTQ